jgi:protein involved in polysaccharide export with SLBB domain
MNGAMKNKFYTISVACLSVLLFSSCITNKQKLYLQNDGSNNRRVAVPFQQYQLGVNDEIIYYLMTSNQGTQYLYSNSSEYAGAGSSSGRTDTPVFRIYEDGCVYLPTVGKIRVAGLTVREAERVIAERFKTVVLDAEVKVALANNYFYVQGDGGKGRFYLYKEDLTIFQALAMAGDISSTGDKQHIKIIRTGADGMDHIRTLDLRQESIVGTEYYYIRPNDVIYIPTNANAFFRIESVSGFISLIVAPLALVLSALTYFK